MLEPTAMLLGVATLVVALALTAAVVPGIAYEGPMGLLGAAILYETLTLGLWLVGPSLLAAMGPLRMIGSTLLYAAILWLVGQVVPGFAVSGLGSSLLGALVIGVTQFAAGLLLSFATMGLILPA